MAQIHSLHDLHKRERSRGKLKPYPNKNKWIRLLDKLLIAVAIAGPLATLPQIFQIFVERNAESVSLVTWFMYAVICVPWLIYGLVHKEKPIIIAYAINIIVNVSVVIGILLYG